MPKHKINAKFSALFRLLLVDAFILAAFPMELAPVAQAAAPASAPAAALAAPTNFNVTLKVVSARTEPRWPGDGTPLGVVKGAQINNYRYIINEDNVGDVNQPRAGACTPTSNANYPDNCNWPSIKAMRASAPVITQGNDGDLNTSTGFDLPAGKYLISVLADGYKIDGLHFTLPRLETTPLVVEAEPFPMPLGNIRIQVFQDNATTNSGWDVPGENPLPNFEGHIADVLGEVTTDWFGNPLCTRYQLDGAGHVILDGDNKPIITTVGGHCLSGPDGEILIPNLGPNRYTGTVTPPPGTTWVQTTTLEGNHDYDIWMAEGASGYDTEFTNPTAEASPPTIFGFVRPTSQLGPPSVTGGIKGTVWGTKTYFPQNGGLVYNGTSYTGGSGTKLDQPISKPWISLNDLNNGDQAVYVGQGNTDGTFNIARVRNGDYSLAYWDAQQDYILEVRNVTVSNGQVTDMGNLFLAGWWSPFKGRVCIDNNNNGKCESGEPGLPNQPVVLKTRSNSVMERGSTVVTTDNNGYYELKETYPLTSWIVMEVFNQRYYTTGVTYQADNQPTPTFVPGAGVDVSIFPIIGLGGTLDWAVRPYEAGTNGGIVGTVTYDTTRNELNPRFAATEDYQPGIPGLHVKLYQPVACTSGSVLCDAAGQYELEANGAYKHGPTLNDYVTEEWERPTDCVARDVNNQPLPVVALDLPLPRTGGKGCIEAPMMGTQFQTGFSTVDGNYGFGTVWQLDASNNPKPDPGKPGDYLQNPMPAGDYLVKVEIPNDFRGKPFYQVTREEDVNVFFGDQFAPQEPPVPCVGALHTVDIKNVLPDGPNAVENPSLIDAGGSPYEGMNTPLCDMKLISVKNGRSIAPVFNFFTEVPLPGRWNGYIVDDLNLSSNPHDTLFGEKRGLPNSPIGIYDFNNRLITTVTSDPNGLFETLMPSTSSYNCPLPAGPCASVYRLVGNDPGQPGKLNPTYDPQYRTISASFEIWPGLIIPADLAPTRIGSIITIGQGSQFNAPSICALADVTPQLFAVNKPYHFTNDNNANRTITLNGQGFGATKGTGRVTLTSATGTVTTLATTAWSDGNIVAGPMVASMTAGTYQLMVTANNGQSTINGLTYHIVSPPPATTGYNPIVIEVDPNKPVNTNPPAPNRVRNYQVIQDALNYAASLRDLNNANRRNALVIVYAGKQDTFNPFGVYYENLIINSPVQLQGVGTGGVRTVDSSYVRGAVLDGLGFAQVNLGPWNTLVTSLAWSGNQQVYEGAVITILAQANGNRSFTSNYKATIDGLTIQGGDQEGTPNPVDSAPNGGIVVTQGGGIYVNGYAKNLQITNNVIKSNGGAYGGGIRLGTPYTQNAQNNNVQNHDIKISQNRILANGGTNLAGGVGVFGGSDRYEIDHNDICGNYSSEYGGGISHYGYSPNGNIHNNRIFFNNSFDEGGGIMIAGELPANPANLSRGAGPVSISGNIIQANLSNDDGGGIRFLMSGNFTYNVFNNFIVNNISTHEGGGIAIDDAPSVRIYNNTIMKNITTATAATSNGQPAPAGISTARNSDQLQRTLSATAPIFSKPMLFNNILWDNRAGTFTAAGQVTGIGLTGDPSPINYWDVGAFDGAGLLEPTYSILQSTNGTLLPATTSVAAHNSFTNPNVKDATYTLSITILPWRTNPYFIGASIVAVDLPPNLMGNYHLSATSTNAIGKGTLSVSNPTQAAPATDIDGANRTGAGDTTVDIGADEYNKPVFP